MRICLACAFMLFFSCFESSAQSGAWSGKLNLGGTELTIVFNISDDACTMDSPDQGAKGIPAQKSYSPAGMLVITVPSIGASYEGLYMQNTIAGTFRQGNLALPLTLKPGAPVLRRPQTPVPPFPYGSEEVSFRNGSATLKGTLTLPQNYSKDTPAVLLVTGSGLQNRDEELFEHKPFAVIADAFARAGIASLRYDDRGFGESTGDIVNFTTEDLKNDALAGVELLKERFARVGVAGHSEGGSIAFMLAADGDVDFIISLAGAVTPMKETLLEQNRYALGEAGISAEVVEEYVSAISKAFDCIVQGLTPPDVSSSILPEALKQNYKAVLVQCSSPYMRYFLSMDVRKILDRVSCPVLAFNGTLDTQVDCKSNLGALREALSPQLLTAVEAAGCNHLFQHCKTGSSAEYKEIEQTMAPEVIEKMTAWINSLR